MVLYRRKKLEMVRLFEMGESMVSIGKILGCSKQNVSLSLKSYYERIRPPKIRETIRIEKCRICESEKETIEKAVPILDLKRMKAAPIKKTILVVCRDCKKFHLYRCRVCGVVGFEGSFVGGFLIESTHTSTCKSCNYNNLIHWRDTHPKRFREIQNKSRKKRLQRLKNNNVLI